MIINLPKLGPVKFRDDLSAEEFQTQLRLLQKKYDFELPKPEAGIMSLAGRGFMRGLGETGIALTDTLPALAGSALGFEDYAKRQMGEAAIAREELEKKYPAQFESYKEVTSPYKGLQYVAETLGELGPTALTAMIPGLGFGAVGTRLAGASALRAAQAAGPVSRAGLAAVEKAAQVGGRRAMYGGVYLGSLAQNAPEVFENIYRETGEMQPGISALAGGISSVLDTIVPGNVLDSLGKYGRLKVAEQVAKQTGAAPKVWKYIGAEAGKSAVAEGLTETAQEAISAVAEQIAGSTKEAFSPENFDRYAESFIKGAIGGGAFGVVGGTGKGISAKREYAALQGEKEEEDRIKTVRTGSAFDNLSQEEEDAGEVVTKPSGAGAGVSATKKPTTVSAVRELALKEQKEAGWNSDWPFVPADLNNPDFRELIRNDPELTDETKRQIFKAGYKLGVVPKQEVEGEARAGEVVTKPSGAGAGVAGVPPAGAAAPGVGGAPSTGLGDIKTPAGKPAVGKGTQRPPVDTSKMTDEELAAYEAEEERRAIQEESGVFTGETSAQGTNLASRLQGQPQVLFDIADFKDQYQSIRGDLVSLINLTAPTKKEIDKMERLNAELTSLVDANAESLTQSSSDPELVQNLKNPTYNGTKDLDRVERGFDKARESLAAYEGDEGRQPSGARAARIQPDMFGTAESASNRANQALQLSGGDGAKAAQSLEDTRTRLLNNFAAGKFDANWAISMYRNMPAGEAARNYKTLAEQHVQRTLGTIDAALEIVRRRGKPGASRAMQMDMFGDEKEEARINQLAEKLEQLRQQKQPKPEQEARPEPQKEMLFKREEAPVEETAESETKETGFQEREGVAPSEERAVAPDVSTEHVANTNEGRVLAGFFDLIKPAAQQTEEQLKHLGAKNAAAGEFLEFDIAEPGETNSVGARRALNYLASLVGGMDRLQSLTAKLEGKSPETQAEILRSFGLPDLTSRRGMETFRDRVQTYFKEVTAPAEGGMTISTREGRIPATGEFKGKAPYSEEVPVITKSVRTRPPGAEKQPRRPEVTTKEKLYNFNVHGLRGAVRAIRQAINAGAKLSPQQIAAKTYLDSKHRDTFGQALNDLAFDLAYFELDPRNHGAGSTFAGEGGRHALLFRAWVKENLDAETNQLVDEMVADYKSNFAAEKAFDQEISNFNEQRTQYERNRLDEVEERTGVRVKRTRKPASERKADLTKNLPRQQMLTEVHPAIVRMLGEGDVNGALQIMADAKGTPYISALAQRLLDSGLTAKSQFIDVNELSPLDNRDTTVALLNTYIDTMVNEVIAFAPVNMREALVQQLKSGTFKGLYDAIRTLDSVLDSADTPQRYSFDKFASFFEEQFEWAAKYDPKEDAIVLRRGFGGMTNITFLHEALHAATLHLIDNNAQLTGIQRQAYVELTRLFETARGVLAREEAVSGTIYGLQDLHEFISEAMTNPIFQAQLRAIAYKSTQISLWNKFTETIGKLFGVKPGDKESNVMVEVMRATDALIATPARLNAMTFAQPSTTETQRFTEEQKYYEGLRTSTKESREEQLKGDIKRQAEDKTKQPKAARISRMRPPPQGMPHQPSDLKRLLTSQNWSTARAELPRLLSSMAATARPYLLGTLTLRQIADLVANRIPQVNNFIRVAEQFLSRKNSILKEAGDISERWQRLQDRDPVMSTDIGRVMHTATITEVDPDKATTQQRNANADLMNQWKALSPEAKQIYRDVRDFYNRRYVEYKRLMNRRIIQMRQLGVSEQTILEIRQEFEKGAMKGPYFPLMRYGRFWYQIGRGATREYYMFESQGQRDAHREERLRRNPELKDTVIAENQYAQPMDLHARESNFLKAAFEAIDDTPMTGMDPLTADKRKQLLKDNMYQTFLSHQPERSFRRQFMHRNNIEGFSQDALRNFASSSFHMAYQLSRFEYSPELFSQIDAARTQLRGRVRDTGYSPELIKENDLLRDYVAEVDRRLELMLNPTDVGVLPSLLSNIGFIWYLTSVASAAVNVLGGAIIGVPTLVGQYVRANPDASYTKATMEVMRQMKTVIGQIMSSGFAVDTAGPGGGALTKLKEFRLHLPSLDRSGTMSAVEKAAYDRMVADGLIDITQTYDVSGLAATPTEQYGGAGHRAMTLLSYLFHNAERFNREVMAMSAFRMAMEKRSGMKDKQQAFAESIAEAKDVTNRAMFDYSSTNKPRYFQHPVARVVLQFKQFPQQMTFFLTKSLIDSLKGASPEVKREARARFVGTMGMTAIMAGTTGLWGYSVVSGIVNAIVNGLSDDDEEPFDFDLAYMQWATDTFGNQLGTLITRGMGNALGVDLASRLKLDEMWFREGRQNQDEEEALKSFLVDLLGPTVGLLPTAARAVQLWNQGQGDRALEAVMPGFIKQPLIAARYAKEGVMTLKGEQMVDDVGPLSLFLQSLGLRPAEVAELQLYNIKIKGQEQKILKKRQDLLNLYGIAFIANDDSTLDRALDKIDEFNDRNPSVQIPIESLSRTVQERLEKSSVTENGLFIDKKLRNSLDRYTYARQ